MVEKVFSNSSNSFTGFHMQNFTLKTRVKHAHLNKKDWKKRILIPFLNDALRRGKKKNIAVLGKPVKAQMFCLGEKNPVMQLIQRSPLQFKVLPGE